jgi:hypothetical protein
MAIKPKCDFCKEELTDYGGLLFSPPNHKSETKKLHVCKDCYKIIADTKHTATTVSQILKKTLVESKKGRVKLTKTEVKEIEDILSVGPAWLNYTRKVKRKKK